MAQSYIIRQSIVRTCRGFCSDYENVKLPRGKYIYSYEMHGLRFCPTCSHKFKKRDWSAFPHPTHCICCKKPMRTRVRCKVEWRKRY